MKVRLLIPIAIFILLIGCDTKHLNGPALDENVEEEINVIECTSIQDLAKIARQLEAIIPKEVLTGQTSAESFMTTDDSEKIAKILEPLKRVGLSVRNQMLNDSQLSRVDLTKLSNLTEQELVFVGVLNIILEDQDQNINANFKTNGYSYEMAASSIKDCLLAAIGFEAMRELINGAAASNYDTVLRAASKLARRTLGYVGAAIMVYELATCLSE